MTREALRDFGVGKVLFGVLLHTGAALALVGLGDGRNDAANALVGSAVALPGASNNGVENVRAAGGLVLRCALGLAWAGGGLWLFTGDGSSRHGHVLKVLFNH